MVASDAVSTRQWDTCVDLLLAAGTYTVSIQEFANFAIGPNLSNGFTETSPTFTSSLGWSNGQFCDATGNNRTNAWAFDILNVEDADVNRVPEPASLALVGLALAGPVTASVRHRTQQASATDLSQ